MKSNKNNLNQGDYYIGLDIGTDSVGWAVTDTTPNYNLLRFKGNLMQGINLFEEANGCTERRKFRSARRREARVRQRLDYLEGFFTDEISKTDPTFFIRLKNSFLLSEDKENSVLGTKYILFCDEEYTDADYMKEYPTVYHLRKELVKSTQPHDVRLVYIAIHHILKKRGHFLFDMDEDSDSALESAMNDLALQLEQNYNIQVCFSNDFADTITNQKLSITVRKKLLVNGLTSDEESDLIDVKVLAQSLAGGMTDLSKLFKNDDFKGAKVKLTDDLDEKYDELAGVI